jgi:hypothetical protein
MPTSLKRTTFIFLVLFNLILTYVPMPVSSLPIVVFHDRISHASNSSYIDHQLVFDVSFTFGTSRDRATIKVFDLKLTSFPVLFIALAVTFLWIVARMTVERFILYVNREPSQSRVLSLPPTKSL